MIQMYQQILKGIYQAELNVDFNMFIDYWYMTYISILFIKAERLQNEQLVSK